MNQYNTLNVKLSNPQLNKLIKDRNKVNLIFSSNIMNDENNFLHKLLLTNTQISKLCKAFSNGSSNKIIKNSIT